MYHFVDMDTGVHTWNMHRTWCGSFKWRNKKQRETPRHYLNSYMVGFMWSSLHKVEIFHSILRVISYFQPPK